MVFLLSQTVWSMYNSYTLSNQIRSFGDPELREIFGITSPRQKRQGRYSVYYPSYR